MLNLDTHILVFALSGDLSRKERALLVGESWGVCGIVLWEIHKLAQLGRIEIDLDDEQVLRVLSKIHVWPIDLQLCQALKLLDFKGDPADELIAATSIANRVPLVTRDKTILRSKVVPLARSTK